MLSKKKPDVYGCIYYVEFSGAGIMYVLREVSGLYSHNDDSSPPLDVACVLPYKYNSELLQSV